MSAVDDFSAWFPVVTLDDVYGEDVAEQLLTWHGVGLLRRFLLVAADGRVHQRSPIQADQGLGDLDPRSLLAELGARSLTVVSVLGPEGPSEAISAQLGRLQEAVVRQSDARWVRLYAVPSDHTAEVGGNSPDPRAHHLVVSLEDRVDDHSMTVAEDASAFPRRLALNAAILAGLFLGQNGDPHLRVMSTVNFQLVRSFARLAVGPVNALDELIHEVKRLRSDNAMMAELAGGVQAQEPVELVNVAAAQFAANAADGELTYHPYPLPPPPVVTRVTLRVALQMLWTFFVQSNRSLLRAAADHAAREALGRLQQRAQRLIFGEGSAYQVDLLADTGALEAPGRLADVAESLLHNAGNMSVQVPATPSLWGQLRDACLSLTDGGTPPNCIEVPHLHDKPMLISDPHLIAPLPDDSALERQGQSGISATERRACDPRTALTELKRLRAESGEDATGEDLAAYEVWLADRSDSFTWQVAKATAAALDTAAEQMVGTVLALRARLTSKEPSAEERAKTERRRRRQLILKVLLAVGFSLLLLASPGIAFAIGAIGLVVCFLLQTGALILVVLLAVARYEKTLRQRFQKQHRLDVSLYQLDNDINSSVHQAREFLRLRSAYVQMVEWSDVLAEVSHHPFGPPVPRDDSEPAELVVAGPLSWVQGQAVIGTATREKLAISCGRRVYGPGWLSSLLANRAHALNAESRLERGNDPHDSSLDVDYDVNAQQGLIRGLAHDLGAEERPGHQDLLYRITEVVFASPVDQVLDAVAARYEQTPATVRQFFNLCFVTDPLQAGSFNDSLLDPSVDQTDGATTVSELYTLSPRLAEQRDQGKSCIMQLNGRICALGLRMDVGNPVRANVFVRPLPSFEDVTPPPPDRNAPRI